jgi:hypothetical protein
MNRKKMMAFLGFGFVTLSACGPVTRPLELGGSIARAAGTQAVQQEDPWPDCLSADGVSLRAELPDPPPGVRFDRVSETRKLLRGLRRDDVIERIWDREEQKPRVLVVRKERTVLLVSFERDGRGGWWASDFYWCPGPGTPTPI